MDINMIISLIYNIALLMALNVIYTIIPKRFIKFKILRYILSGLVIGIIGITIMIKPLNIFYGVALDTRSILFCISGLFLGLVPTLIATIITMTFRIMQGGFVWIGIISTIIIPSAIGLIWRKYRFNRIKESKTSLLELYLLGIVVHIGVIVTCIFLFPWELAFYLIKNISLLIIIIYPIGTVLLGKVLISQFRQREVYSKLQESEERLKITLLSVGDGVITTDEYGMITLLNPVAEEITGFKSEEVKGKFINDAFVLLNENTKNQLTIPIQKVFNTGKIINLSNRTIIISKDGFKKPISDSLAPIKDQYGNIKGIVFIIRDITEERRRQKEVDYYAYHDGLTGLYNHRFFDQELIRLESDEYLPLSIIIGDVNGLKLINDAFGHTMGDNLLKEMAKNIKVSCRKKDIVTRWGGDEFVVLLPNTDSESTRMVCERIDEKCSTVKMSDVNCSISLGYETKSFIDDDIMQVLKRAENHMYRKKSTGKSSMRGNTIGTILSTLYEKNPREEKHSKRVCEICKKIGTALKLSKEEINELGVIGLMHDIGKIAISNSVLNKKGDLSEGEWKEIKRHPEIGYRILSASNDMAYIAQHVLKHHERLDGYGYPKGITQDEIPFQTRILAIADAYDAMTRDRPYRMALSDDWAIDELKRESGKAFDSKIVDVFIEKVLKH